MGSDRAVSAVDAAPSRDGIHALGLTEDPLARAVGLVLRWGVLLAAAITAAGGVVLLAHGASVPDLRDFRGPVAATSTVGGIVSDAWHARGAALIQAGLLVLIATPVARVVMLLVGFWHERRWLYVALSAIVLAALTASLVQTR